MLIEASVYDEVVDIAAEYVSQRVACGPSQDEGRHMGPVASSAQYDKVQRLIETGIAEGARLVCGGAGRPDGLGSGFYCKPTLFADVTPGMTISREEIFGPVLCLTPFADEAEAVRLANDTPFGLTSYLQTSDSARVRRLVPKLRAGMVEVNGARRSPRSPFGGVKQSGNGREGGEWGLREFLEVKAVFGLLESE